MLLRHLFQMKKGGALPAQSPASNEKAQSNKANQRVEENVLLFATLVVDELIRDGYLSASELSRHQMSASRYGQVSKQNSSAASSRAAAESRASKVSRLCSRQRVRSCCLGWVNWDIKVADAR